MFAAKLSIAVATEALRFPTSQLIFINIKRFNIQCIMFIGNCSLLDEVKLDLTVTKDHIKSIVTLIIISTANLMDII